MSGNLSLVDENGSSGSQDDLNVLDGPNKRPALTHQLNSLKEKP